MDESERVWRQEAERLPPSALRTELYEELRTMLALREVGEHDIPEEWLSEMERFFSSEYERSEAEAETVEDEGVMLSELFLDEGVEGWLEAFHLFREGASDSKVLEVAEEAQRMLLLVQMMARRPR